jgi:hypothetical protein
MSVATEGTFRLSRIYAEGWNAANRLSTGEVDAIDPARLASRNPYVLEAERSRWTSGFTAALAAGPPRGKRKAFS